MFCSDRSSSFQSSFVGAIAVGDLVKSTLGPKGMVSKSELPLGASN